MGTRFRRKEYSPPLVVDAMKRPSTLRSIVIISIISACVAFWPMMYIDVDLFEIFVKSGVYKKYAEDYVAKTQIDDVDEEVILEP